jgi:hypothetical protein
MFRRFFAPCCAVFVLSLVHTAPASAQDKCEFFSGLDRTGDSVTYTLPSENVAGQPWSNVSRRFEGANLKVHAPAIYSNLESVRITANDSDVTLYVYDGDNFDGRFQAVRFAQGGVHHWNFGSMRNRVKSIICQRDPRLPAGQQVVELLVGFQDNHLIPTSMLADAMTAEIHDLVRSERSRFYDNKIDIRQGRMIWDTAHELCKSVSCASINDEWRRKYWDFLRYSYKSRGRLKADGKTYTISIDIWIEPFLNDAGDLRFRVDAWKVDVSNWIWHNRIQDAVESRMRAAVPDIGNRLLTGLTETLDAAVGQQGADLLRDNDQLVFSYACNSLVDRVGYPNYNYTGLQINNICAGTTPEDVVAPGLRLLRN